MGVQQKQREKEAAPRCVLFLYVCVCIYVCIYVCAYVSIYTLFLQGAEFSLPLAPLALTSMLLGYLGVWEEGEGLGERRQACPGLCPCVPRQPSSED